MAGNRKPKSLWRRIAGSLLTLAVIGLSGIIGWNYLKPLVTTDAVPIYESFCVERGDIKTTISYSATISLINQQSVSASQGIGMNMSTVRSIDVAESQRVKVGDRLAQLSNGEILTAEIDGVVNAINVSVGDRVRMGGSIMDICDFDNLQMSMSVDEYDIDALKRGQQCTVTVLPLGLSFETELDHINRLSSGMGSMAYYQVTGRIDAPENVLPGMQAMVSFQDQQALNVLTLDMRAIAFDEEGNPYVLISDGETYERCAIETGLSDGMKVEVISGLQEGEQVWAVTGYEAAEPAFTIESLYKKLVGERTIINDTTARDGRQNRQGGGQFPRDMTMPEGMEMPEGFTLPEGMSMPDGMTLPEGFILPDGVEAPSGAATPEDREAGRSTESYKESADEHESGTADPDSERGGSRSDRTSEEETSTDRNQTRMKPGSEQGQGGATNEP